MNFLKSLEMNWGPVFDLQSMSELKVTDRADDVQHALMLRLLFQTAVRMSELCRIQIGDMRNSDRGYKVPPTHLDNSLSCQIRGWHLTPLT